MLAATFIDDAAFTAETAPLATSRMKVVGFAGVSGDITATATGLGATTLDFTTLDLNVGQWIKIGGTGAGNRFATAALNDFARVTAIAATALTLDNLPAAWATDAGTGKTIEVWFSDCLKNGTTKKGVEIERGFMDQASPTFILQKGMLVDKFSMKTDAKQKVTASFTYTGMSGVQSTTSIDSTPDAAPDPTLYPVMAASANVGRVGENGAQLTSPNWCKTIDLSLSNNLAPIEAVDSATPVDIAYGSCDVEATVDTYFGDNTLLTQLFAGTVASLNWRTTKGTQAVVWGIPAATATDGAPNAAKKDDRVMLLLKMTASYDALTQAHLTLSRFEYFEA